MIRFVKLTFIVVVVASFTIFAIVNRGAVTVSFFPFPYSATLPTFLIVILSVILGAGTAGLIMGFKTSKARRLFIAEHKKVSALENEISALRLEQESKTPVALRAS